MSAGKFTLTKYQASYGTVTQIHPIRVQPETLAADFSGSTNDAPAGAINNDISALVSRGARRKGLKPRSVALKLKDGETPPPGYDTQAITRIPILTPNVFTSIAKADEVDYLGATWVVIAKYNEDVD